MNSNDVPNGKQPEAGSVLWAWVAQEEGEHGVARLQTAWIPLGTINLVAFGRDVMAHPNLIKALQEQADKDGQTVRLVRFIRGEEVMTVRPAQEKGPK
jgi:hypothetical protein